MKIRPLIVYVSCAFASFALAMGAVVHASTFGARYPGNPSGAAPPRCTVNFLGSGASLVSCPFITGSAFPTTSVTQLTLDFVNNNNMVSSGPTVRLCNIPPGGDPSDRDCSCTQTGTTTQGSVEFNFTMTGSDVHTCTVGTNQVNILDWWNDSSFDSNYCWVELSWDTTNTQFNGYKVSGSD